MSKLFEESDSDIEIKTNNEYAKSYDTWRKKEEINKFKARHGELALDIENEDNDNEESSSDDDETAVELTQEVEKDFYKTLALLKNNDPSIYDDSVVFFKQPNENERAREKVQKEKKLFVKDYERELLLEKGKIESEDEDNEINTGNFAKEDEFKLKESFKDLCDDSDDDIGSLLKARESTKEETIKREEDYKAWLIGQEKKLKDKETASSLKPLKDYWTDERLDDGEKFLRDYLLNNRYLEKEDENYIPTYDEIVQNLSEDENQLDKQEEFEHKYNFRFEDPDHEFIKRYPRTIEGSLRREDNKRKLKRIEVKERKAKEKEEKMNELKKLREITRKEIEEKIEKLKEITGNEKIGFKDEDIEGDFDPEEHDKRMQALFSEEYYQDGPEEDIKPPIDLDDEDALELQPENYDNWTGPCEDEEVDAPHCEDDDFNMDADYDPKATQKELVENSRKRKKRKRKSKFVEMLSKQRPKFDPLDKNYEKYVDEYYKFECEDVIDDIPCKFKYRKVVPNNFGLTVEEILLANDRELNKWCSLKKAVSLREDHVEKYEQTVYERKGQNVALKKKLIPSLFVEEEPKEEEKSEELSLNRKRKIEEHDNVATDVQEPSQKKKKVNNNETIQSNSKSEEEILKEEKCEEISVENKNKSKRKKKKESSENKINEIEVSRNDNEQPSKKFKKKLIVQANGDEEAKTGECVQAPSSTKKSKKKHILQENEKVKSDGCNEAPLPTEVSIKETETKEKKNINIEGSSKKKKNKRKKKNEGKSSMQDGEGVKRNKKQDSKKFNKKPRDLDIGISDSRIACFGWNPKKFKNKLIYGNKDQDN